MARTRQLQRAGIPKSFTSRGSAPRPTSALALLVVCALTAVWAVAMLSPYGSLLHSYMFVFTTFYAGPVTLVSLSLTVMTGLVATDRIVLLIRHRVLLQSAHRSLGIIAVFGLVLHVLTKLSAGYVSPSAAFLPFVTGADIYVGLGTVAALLMVGVLWTGLIRARFAGIGRPWMWRALHSVAYASWPIALVHGLYAGRPAATWVTVSYLLCVALVIAALLVRASVGLNRKRGEQGQTTGSIAPVGRPATRPGATVRTASSRTARTTPAWRRTADEIRASRRAGEPTRTPRLRDDALEPSWRDARLATDTVDDGGIRVGRDRRASLDDLRDDRGAAIDSWVRADAADTGEFDLGRAYRFAVPEVPLPRADTVPGRRRTPSDAEVPWDSPRRWAGGEQSEDTWDSPRPGSTEPGRYRRPDPADDEHARYRRPAPADDEHPVARSGRHSRPDSADDEAESTSGWGRAARYEPDLVADPAEDDDDDAPTLIDLASRRARRAGRSARRRRTDEADEEGAYWTRLRGEAR